MALRTNLRSVLCVAFLVVFAQASVQILKQDTLLFIRYDMTTEDFDPSGWEDSDDLVIALSFNNWIVDTSRSLTGEFRLTAPMFQFQDTTAMMFVFDRVFNQSVDGWNSRIEIPAALAAGMRTLESLDREIVNPSNLGWFPFVTLLRRLSLVYVSNGTQPLQHWIPLTDYEPLSNPLLPLHRLRHHPVFFNWHQWVGPRDPGFIVDFLGIATPLAWDCRGRLYGYDYLATVPSRAIPCEAHQWQGRQVDLIIAQRGYDNSSTGLVAGFLPIVDDEYFEWVDVLESVLRAGSDYVIIELGARYGTWGVRAAVAHRRLRAQHGLPEGTQRFIGNELEPAMCEWVREHAERHDVDLELLCEGASSSQLLSIISRNDHVDMLDMDIQGAEYQVLLGPDKNKVFAALDEKVWAVHIGVHSPEISDVVTEEFLAHGWIQTLFLPMTTLMFQCDPLAIGSVVWDSACHTRTTYGPVYIRDGAVCFVNPRAPNAGNVQPSGWQYDDADRFFVTA